MIRFSPYVYIISGCPTVLSYLGVALMRRLNACPPKTNGASEKTDISESCCWKSLGFARWFHWELMEKYIQ